MFPSANEEELNLMSKVLRYENRVTVNELLQSDFFLDVKSNIRVGEWISEKSQLNPYFNYIDLVKTE